jgi:hypothetical protein
VKRSELQRIADFYGRHVSGDQVLIPTPGHSSQDRGAAIKFEPSAPGGILVHTFNGTTVDALSIKGWLRRDGFLSDRSDYQQPLPNTAAIDFGRCTQQREAAVYAQQLLDQASSADPAHPYLVRKRIAPEQLSQWQGALLVPMFDAEGAIWNIQRIAADGRKRFSTAGGRPDCSGSRVPCVRSSVSAKGWLRWPPFAGPRATPLWRPCQLRTFQQWLALLTSGGPMSAFS